ncbi:hypothetical protein PG994_012889 [Apiospora phragmitis]|uniref:Uncharacterized protein n=1 Tax=Apiospora phragmitis TaxID=2905665 RepID=A0ABR1T735_9PEZI
MSDMPGPWQPGYWEVAGETGEHGPPAELLEYGRVIPSRCALWMKLIIYTQGLGPRFDGVHGPQDFRNMSVQDGWAYGRDAWLSCMELMAEKYAHPPDREATWTEDIPPNERHTFRQSLSDSPVRSWEILRDCPDKNIDSIRHKESIYQQVLFALWDAEFNLSAWLTGTSRGLDSNRRMAYEHAVAQKAGFLILQELGSNLTPREQQERDMELPSCYDIFPWLPKELSDNKNPEHLPLYLWDTTENRTRHVKELLEVGVPIDYACISHTWGRWKKKSLSCVRVRGAEWEIPENTV